MVVLIIFTLIGILLHLPIPGVLLPFFFVFLMGIAVMFSLKRR